jgi:hypothetical protein
MDQYSKRFIFAEEFIRERNGSKVIHMTNDSPDVNRTLVMSQLLLFVSLSSSGARLYC